MRPQRGEEFAIFVLGHSRQFVPLQTLRTFPGDPLVAAATALSVQDPRQHLTHLRHGSHIDFNAVGKPDFTCELGKEGSQRLGTICRVPVNPRAPHSNLLLTMAQKMGAQIDRFHNSTGTIADVVK